ncbi:MAG TPA: hypothetical protein VEW26_15455 [Allosphingosinicella sp.]|nr:hypothetical protein [Allosphingosinicella sp.]
MKSVRFGLAALVAAGSGAAFAQSDTATSGPYMVTGTVPVLCTAGTLSDDNGVFAVGVLVDLSTGLLRNDLSAPPKILQGSFCTSRSTITIEASPLVAQASPQTPPEGFSNTVHFTATAEGWTPAPAVFTTGSATNPNAVQTRETGFTGDIVVSIGSFTTDGGASLRLVEDPLYQGAVVVTLAAAD